MNFIKHELHNISLGQYDQLSGYMISIQHDIQDQTIDVSVQKFAFLIAFLDSSWNSTEKKCIESHENEFWKMA